VLTADQALASAGYRLRLSQPGASVEDVADALVGLHTTSPVSPYLSLRARVPSFVRSDLDALMWGSWDLVRFRAMRNTMFVLSRQLLEEAAQATHHVSEAYAGRWLRDSGLTARQFDRLADAIDGALADRPLTVRALRAVLDVPKTVDVAGIVSRLCDVGRLVGGAPPRSWRSSIRQYHRWVDVLPDVDLHRYGQVTAIRKLIQRYVGAYGPVTMSDIAWWTGFTKGQCTAALDALGSGIEEVSVADWPGPLYRIAGDDPPASPASGVRALPLLDPYVQGYRDRVRLVEPERHGYVYDGGGNASATLVGGGRIFGVWQPSDEPEESVRYHLFGRQPRTVRRAVEADLAAAGAMYFDRSVDVIEVADMQPLSAGGGRSAMHPLDDRIHRAARRQRGRNG